MNNKTTNVKTMDWFSDPQFIENAEELAMSLINSFPINRIEALTIVIIESMCSHNVICTKKKIRDLMTSQFRIVLDEEDTKSIERIFNIVSSGQSRLNGISSPWIEYLWKEKAFSNELMEATDIPDCKDIADFYEIDPRAISLIKHAIKAKSPIALTIDDFLRHMSLGIIKQLLEKEGIYCLIGSKMHSNDSGIYAMQAIQAMHLEGIAIFPEGKPSAMAEFISMAQIFGLRFATLKTEGQIVISESDDESTNDDIPSIEYVPTINVKPLHISGEALRKKAAEYFGSDNPDFLRILINSKSNVAALCRSKALINEIIEKEDWESLSKFLGDAPKADISEDTKKRRQVNSDQYDIRVINSDLPVEILDKMAEKAFRQHSPWKLLLSGESGTGKSAYAYHLAERLGIEVIVKRPQDLIFRYFGESETAIASAFKEAESKNALLLLDEADGYLSHRTDVLNGGDKGYNDITNAFLVGLEEYGGIIIATTNLSGLIDPALIRRFHKNVTFRFPTYEGMKILFERYFPDVDFDKRDLERICSLESIGSGDFIAVKELSEYMEDEDVTGEFILESLSSNASARCTSSRKSPPIIGFKS